MKINERTVRNPKTGEVFENPEHFTLKFKPIYNYKEQVKFSFNYQKTINQIVNMIKNKNLINLAIAIRARDPEIVKWLLEYFNNQVK